MDGDRLVSSFGFFNELVLWTSFSCFRRFGMAASLGTAVSRALAGSSFPYSSCIQRRCRENQL